VSQLFTNFFDGVRKLHFSFTKFGSARARSVCDRSAGWNCTDTNEQCTVNWSYWIREVWGKEGGKRASCYRRGVPLVRSFFFSFFLFLFNCTVVKLSLGVPLCAREKKTVAWVTTLVLWRATVLDRGVFCRGDVHLPHYSTVTLLLFTFSAPRGLPTLVTVWWEDMNRGWETFFWKYPQL
jgi:hypothetical protein